MSNPAIARNTNTVYFAAPAPTRSAIFLGGTSGIGQAMAEAFAVHTKGNANIVLVGRNREAAEASIAKFPKPTIPNITHEFVHCDASLMRNVQSMTTELLERYPKLNYLILTPGILSMKGRTETSEGIDVKLALHYYARWKCLDGLLPALREAQGAGEDAKVLSVLAAGHGGAIDDNDLGLKKSFSLRTAAMAAPTYTDLMLEEYAAWNSGITFAHAYPGIVDTPILNTWGNAIGWLSRRFTISAADSGEYLLSGLVSSPPGAQRLGMKGNDIGQTRYHGSESQRKKTMGAYSGGHDSLE